MPATENQEAAYVRRSWKMFTQEEGWIKLVVVLLLAVFVPIVGWFGIAGYGLEWARCTAWGSDTAPKRRDIDVGKCIVSGARAILIFMSYSIAFLIVSRMLFDVLLAISLSNHIVRIASFAVDAFVLLVAFVAALNATIYQRIAAGYDVKHIYSMMSSDPKGLIGVVGVQVIYISCVSVFSALFAIQIFGVVLPPFLADILRSGHISSIRYDSFVFFGFNFFFLLVSSAIIPLININAVGLWMRQFDVASWGPPFSSTDVLQNRSKVSAPPSPADAYASESSDVPVPPVSPSSPVPPVLSSSPAPPVPPDSPPFPVSPSSPVPPASSASPPCPASPAPPPPCPVSPAPPPPCPVSPAPPPPCPVSSASPPCPASPASPPPPIPPQDGPAFSGKAAQSQGASLSSDVSSAGDAQVEEAATPDEKGAGHDIEEDDKKASN